MTAQIGDVLTYQDKHYSMATEPLKPYLEFINFKEFSAPHTACWRGYIGSWIIKENHLFLNHLKAYIKNNIEVDLNYLFPDQLEIFAYWFNGKIFLPHGELLQYHHAGYASVYEKTMILEFENGILISKSYRTNNIKEDDYRDFNNNDNLPF